MRSLHALLLPLLVLVGCSKGSGIDPVGSWKADVAKSELGSKTMSQTEKDLAKNILSGMTLNVKEDKTFAMTIVGDIHGNWALTGNKLVLTPEKKPGETLSFGGKDAMDFVIEPDGKSMSFTSSDPAKPGTLVMVKTP